MLAVQTRRSLPVLPVECELLKPRVQHIKAEIHGFLEDVCIWEEADTGAALTLTLLTLNATVRRHHYGTGMSSASLQRPDDFSVLGLELWPSVDN